MIHFKSSLPTASSWRGESWNRLVPVKVNGHWPTSGKAITVTKANINRDLRFPFVFFKPAWPKSDLQLLEEVEDEASWEAKYKLNLSARLRCYVNDLDRWDFAGDRVEACTNMRDLVPRSLLARYHDLTQVAWLRLPPRMIGAPTAGSGDRAWLVFTWWGRMRNVGVLHRN